MKELREIIASNISNLRSEKKITQYQLAEVLNYSDKAVSKWERGESIPDISVLKQIAEYFEVTVDYLISETHDEYDEKKQSVSKTVTRNRNLIASLATVMVWLVATVAFIFISQFAERGWISFIYAVPASVIVILVFNCIWGKPKYNFMFITLLVWSALMCIFLSLFVFAKYNFWLLFILGIPAQIMIILSAGLRKVKK